MPEYLRVRNLNKRMKTYKELIVWQKGIDLVSMIYKITNGFPKEEMFGLTSQIRRASVAIPSNIAEGFGRNSKGDFKRFLQISNGSLFELQTQLEISKRLQFLSDKDYNLLYNLSREVEAILTGLIQKLKT